MADLRKDPVTGRWVIISTERQKRPSDFHVETVTTKGDMMCPFCQGHEDKTPPEILAYRNGISQASRRSGVITDLQLELYEPNGTSLLQINDNCFLHDPA